MKYGHMPGAHDEGIKDNPAVHSKYDKSQGRGLPAPHLKHPGEVAKESGTKMPGHNENGHKMPVERSVGLGGSHLRHGYTPGEMGAPMITGTGQGHAKNSRLTDGNVVKSAHQVGMDHYAGREPNAVHAGMDKHSKQHDTRPSDNRMGGGTDRKMGASRPQKMEDSSRRSKEPHGTLDRVKMKGRS